MNQQLKDIKEPHDHDVLYGRGNFVNYHKGNAFFRDLVRKNKQSYVKADKRAKKDFAVQIVNQIRNRAPPGRFLKQNPSTELWEEVGEIEAMKKARQALREGAPMIIDEIGRQETDKIVPNNQTIDLSGIMTGVSKMTMIL
mmetsp:Transcript_5514/g.8025  ORF Transcript_5514/g.8025 Transcript_5514/m.8025 type:complete len:141 (+) Transcript_5514:93-515(+)